MWGFGTFILLFLGMAFTNTVIDPLHILKAPEQRDLYDRQTRYALPGLLRQNKAPYAIIGTSVIQDFDETYFEEQWDADMTRYPILGGTGYEQRRALETLLTSAQPPETVIWGLDVASFTGELKRIRWAQFPEHLFSNSLLVYPRYIFSFETFYRALRLIPDRARFKTPQSRFVYEADNLEFSRDAVLRSYCGDGLEKRINHLKNFNFSTQFAQIKTNILAPILQNSDTNFILFFPPYSAVQYAEFDRAGVLDHVLSFRQNVLKTLKNQSHVTLYDFQSSGEIVNNLNYYRDPFHYGQPVMHWMSEQWKNGTNILSAENLESRQRKIRDFAEQYSGIWDGVNTFCTTYDKTAP